MEQTNIDIYAKLMAIQSEVKCGKSHYNKFGGFKYRSAEDVLETVKPIAARFGTCVVLHDNIEVFGDRVYIKATATLYDASTGQSISAQAYAREDAAKKGMDGAQLSGATSSYARKYALSGLFGLDDAQDSDTQDNTQIGQKSQAVTSEELPAVNVQSVEDTSTAKAAVVALAKSMGRTEEQLKVYAQRLTGHDWDALTAEDIAKIKLGMVQSAKR